MSLTSQKCHKDSQLAGDAVQIQFISCILVPARSKRKSHILPVEYLLGRTKCKLHRTVFRLPHTSRKVSPPKTTCAQQRIHRRRRHGIAFVQTRRSTWVAGLSSSSSLHKLHAQLKPKRCRMNHRTTGKLTACVFPGRGGQVKSSRKFNIILYFPFAKRTWAPGPRLPVFSPSTPSPWKTSDAKTPTVSIQTLSTAVQGGS